MLFIARQAAPTLRGSRGLTSTILTSMPAVVFDGICDPLMCLQSSRRPAQCPSCSVCTIRALVLPPETSDNELRQRSHT